MNKQSLVTRTVARNGGEDVSKFKYVDAKYQISATKIIGKTIYTKLETGCGEGKKGSKFVTR